MIKSGKKSVTGKRIIQQAERRAEILHLRIEGLTLQQIADKIGIDTATVHGIISRALQAITKEPTQELLALELHRCDTLLNEAMQTVQAFHPLIHAGRVVSAPMLNEQGEPIRNPQTGDVLTRVLEDKAPKLAAITTAVRVLERRAKLLGLDAPIRTSQQIEINPLVAQDLSHLTTQELEDIKNRLYPAPQLSSNKTPTGTIQ